MGNGRTPGQVAGLAVRCRRTRAGSPAAWGGERVVRDSGNPQYGQPYIRSWEEQAEARREPIGAEGFGAAWEAAKR